MWERKRERERERDREKPENFSDTNNKYNKLFHSIRDVDFISGESFVKANENFRAGIYQLHCKSEPQKIKVEEF